MNPLDENHHTSGDGATNGSNPKSVCAGPGAHVWRVRVRRARGAACARGGPCARKCPRRRGVGGSSSSRHGARRCTRAATGRGGIVVVASGVVIADGDASGGADAAGVVDGVVAVGRVVARVADAAGDLVDEGRVAADAGHVEARAVANWVAAGRVLGDAVLSARGNVAGLGGDEPQNYGCNGRRRGRRELHDLWARRRV